MLILSAHPLYTAMACKAITNPQFGYRIDTSHQQGILQQISFQCQSGYHMTGPYTLTCSASGHWSSELPTCSCKWWPEAIYSWFCAMRDRTSLIMPSSNSTHDCKLLTYIQIIDRHKRIPIFIVSFAAIMCGPPPDVEHGTPSSGPPYRYTAIVSYDCEPGYALYPEGITIQCMDNSQWTSSIAECRREWNPRQIN